VGLVDGTEPDRFGETRVREHDVHAPMLACDSFVETSRSAPLATSPWTPTVVLSSGEAGDSLVRYAMLSA
jgi:hypothetical protein